MSDIVFRKVEEGIGEIVFNRPEKRNAFTNAMFAEFYDTLRSLEVQELKAVVIRGEGKNFCGGVDLNEVANPVKSKAPPSMAVDLAALYRNTRPVLIAAVNGPTLGLGASIAMSCDMVVAGETTQFGYPEVHHGLVATFALIGLSAVVPMRKAFELVITGRRIPVAEALQLGMINEIAPDADVVERAYAMARDVAQYNDMAIHTTKRFFYENQEMPYSVSAHAADRVTRLMRQTNAARKQAAAFLEAKAKEGAQ
ncbi:enoyl-CoA hydratase/isomerase family protein [Phenylobacterium sp.]|uniref:enoyl-CoA hydratase/isomerase family protein n=1 Tax=Phenylobacterium sp. TaxID=1871053 RepID=UPI00301BC89E